MIREPSDFKPLIVDLLTESEGDRVVILLSGDLGAGKTAFTQELGKYLGVKEKINSPTFIIMKSYQLDDKRFGYLVHIDAYRLDDEEEAKPLRLDEVFAVTGQIVCVEWPERISDFLPADAYRLQIEIKPDQSRIVTVKSPAEK